MAQGVHGPFAGQHPHHQRADVVGREMAAGAVGEQPPVCGCAGRVPGGALRDQLSQCRADRHRPFFVALAVDDQLGAPAAF